MWEMRRSAGPVQQWVDSIPSPTKTNSSDSNQPQKNISEQPNMPMTEPKDIPFAGEKGPPSMIVSAPINVPNSPGISTTALPSSLPYRLARDPSLQSDSSHCSSVESLLELRKADPEAILLGLGFGGCSNSPQESGSLSRIPKRFLQPSKLKGIAINDFMKHQQETSESFDSVSLGYRGLTGSPYVAPSEIVQKIMDRLREYESHETDPYAMYNNCHEQYTPIQQNGRLSVLSPDNRQFLERPRSKSPDMCNKRIIIGQKSFTFGHDGDLIEVDTSPKKQKNILKINPHYAKSLDTPRQFSREKKSEKVPILKIEKWLPKQVSFDDSVEISEIRDSILAQSREENIKDKDSSNDTTNQRSDIALDDNFKKEQISKYSSDVRRASDGSFEVKVPPGNSATSGTRRHSASNVHDIEDSGSDCNSSQKRKVLKRQSRISDVDASDYCNSSAFVQPNSNLHDEISQASVQSIDENTNLTDERESRGANLADQFLEETHSRVPMANNTTLKEARLQKTDKRRLEDNHCAGNTDQKCAHGEDYSKCRCCRDPTKYWKKMEKIMQKNKKLESMVAKNQREMAEIREMINSVLSVRMEPGF